MFTIKRSAATICSFRIPGLRFQSSSSGTKYALEQQQKIQNDLLEKNKKKNANAEEHKHLKKDTKTLSNINRNNDNLSPIKLRKGFSTVIKVPSTLNVETKDILLDKLYQGYNPLLSPITNKPKKVAPKILVNIYEDIAFDEDGFEEEDIVDSMMGPKLHVSRHIYDKDPTIEAKLKGLDQTVESEVKTAKSLASKQTVSYVERNNNSNKRGRARLQYKKKLPKSDK